jgi:beta-galactosidase
MKSSLKLLSLVLLLFLRCGIMVINGQSRNISVIDNSWKFKLYDDPNSSQLNFDDSNWETVTLPHTWNNYDGQDGGGNYYRGTGWYRKLFHLNNVSGKCVFLKFNSANLKAEVYVNGSLVGNHIGGYSAFIFNITEYIIQESDNLIAVKVSNDASLKFAPLSGDFTFYGGITRNVELWVTNDILISPLDYASSGVYITPSNISESNADINVRVLLANFSNVNATITENYTIKDAHNNTVNSFNANSTLLSKTNSIVNHKFSISNPVLWQGLKNPYLYTLEISLTVNGSEVDRLAQKFGVRTLDSNPDSGIYLNGKRYPLHGVAFHEDRKDKGRAISDLDRKTDLEILKETGLNFFRLAHYQHGQFTYDYCDSTGIILWTEIPLLEKIDNSSSAFSDNIKEQLKELIKQNYNHPSVCFWGLFNEIETQSDSPDALQVVTELNSLAKSLDNSRYTVAATNMDIPSNSVPDLFSWNLYYGWYYNTIPDFSKFMDNWHKDNPEMIMGVSEYGAGASIIDHAENPGEPIADSYYHPEEYQNYYHEEHWKAIMQRPFIWASSIWVGFDFASDARKDGDYRGINDKGLITRDRLVKKDTYFFYKANWSSSPVVYITSRRSIERTEANTSAKIYSNSDSVKLLVNNTSYGYLKSSDHIFSRNIVLADGLNMIKALGIKNGLITRDSCIWYLNDTPDDIVKINFETTSTITPSGYKADKGNVYGDRGNGLTYGWNEDNTVNARERSLAPDKAFDTFNHLQPGDEEYSWEIAVNSGTYAIYVACGDPAYFDSHHKLAVENKTVIDGIPSASSPWLTAMDTVVVNDGKLTVRAAAGGINTKINFLHLTRIDSVSLTISKNQVEIQSCADTTSNFFITSNTSWSIVSNQPWLTADINSGTGNATITISATANPEIAARTATITISAGDINKTIEITQEGAAIVLQVSKDHISLEPDSGSSESFTITSNTSWSIVSNQPWLTADINSGTGNVTITISATANPGIAARTATITISAGDINNTIEITQEGAAIVLQVSKDHISLEPDSGSSESFTITSNTSWSIVSNQPWLTAGITSGTGNVAITLLASANPGIAARNATMTISAGDINKTIEITQEGAAIVLQVSKDHISLEPEPGSSESFTITSNTSWTISSSEEWLFVNIWSGSDDALVLINATENGSENPRIATIIISGNGIESQTITVTQSGSPITIIPKMGKSDLSIFPNPFTDKVHIFIKKLPFHAEIEIYSIQGELLFHSLLDQNVFYIDLNNYPAGVYTIKLISDEQVITGKVIKQQ